MIIFSKSRLAAAGLVLAALLPLQASAGLLDDDEARRAILDLRAKVDTLARDINARLETKSDKTSALEALNRHEQTMQEIARLRGEIEVLSNALANVQKNQKDLYADIDARIKKLEPRQVNIDGQETAVAPTEQQTYEAAMATLKAGDYKAAAAALTDFVRKNPESPYAANAQYWLGNAYYVLRDHKKSIAAQQVVTSTYKDSAKAPDALLNIASNYVDMNDKKNAKKTLQQVVSKYPQSTAAKTAKDRLAALK
ncbi:tol-pal system protein YbgF [Massilia cavernae]|uniref:Cell division coordinator CpoB n=1 Tax=Massilia cavernae TaxID=2320864 RepID=A0A418Y5Y0_9BURK|nr:tol-pal system protein YbgF [Massilia cavernae]RJG22382.1 tol-pal system protein YbgF [Massilia cavernae]